MARLPQNKKQIYLLNYRSQMWPWPWIFKVKYGICYISTKSGPIATKQNVNILIELQASNVTNGFDLGHDLDIWIFKVKCDLDHLVTKFRYKDLPDSDRGDFRWLKINLHLSALFLLPWEQTCACFCFRNIVRAVNCRRVVTWFCLSLLGVDWSSAEQNLKWKRNLSKRTKMINMFSLPHSSKLVFWSSKILCVAKGMIIICYISLWQPFFNSYICRFLFPEKPWVTYLKCVI